MATTDAQLEELRARVRDLSIETLHVADVQVEEADGPDGPTVVVTVVLATSDPSQVWDPDQFLAIRRKARTVALEVLQGRDVSLVYEAEPARDVEDQADDGQPEDVDIVGGKNVPESE